MRSRFATVLLVLASTSAVASGRNQAVPLSDVVARSEAIVIAKPASPPAEEGEIPLVSADGTRAPAEPWSKYEIARWEVVEVLSHSAPIKVGDVIRVYPGDLEYRLLMLEARNRGVNKIGLFEHYETRAKPGKEATRILFLRAREDGSRAFTVKGAVEPVKSKAKVLKLIARDPAK